MLCFVRVNVRCVLMVLFIIDIGRFSGGWLGVVGMGYGFSLLVFGKW